MYIYTASQVVLVVKNLPAGTGNLRDTDVKNKLLDYVGEDKGGMI